jgi:hypothetical protein
VHYTRRPAASPRDEKRKALPPDAVEVVTVDLVRPNGRHHPPPTPADDGASLSRRMTIGGPRVSSRSSRSTQRRYGSGSYFPDVFDQEPDRMRTRSAVDRPTSALPQLHATTRSASRGAGAARRAPAGR